MRKSIDKMINAYNDSKGVTSKFNINLLTRINKELGANFDVDYAIAMCDRAKAAILDEDREQSSIFYLDLENDDEDEDDEDDEEFAGFDVE